MIYSAEVLFYYWYWLLASCKYLIDNRLESLGIDPVIILSCASQDQLSCLHPVYALSIDQKLIELRLVKAFQLAPVDLAGKDVKRAMLGKAAAAFHDLFSVVFIFRVAESYSAYDDLAAFKSEIPVVLPHDVDIADLGISDSTYKYNIMVQRYISKMLSGILYRITTEAADQPFCILVAAAVLTAGDYNGIRPYDLAGFFAALHGRSVSVSCHRITSLLMLIYILLTK